MVRFLDAELRALRIYDVADEIRLEACRALIERGGSASKRMKLDREGSEYVHLSNPPLLVQLGVRTLHINEMSREAQLTARIFDFGCISMSIALQVPQGTSIEMLLPLTDQLSDNPAVDALALDEVNKLRRALGSTFHTPHLWEQNEGYTIIFVRAFDGNPTIDDIVQDPQLARLLVTEVKEPLLSIAEQKEILSEQYSYTPNDLTIIEWDVAFLYEPSGSTDLIDLLEFANAQLLELRYYDHVLDAELSQVYDVIDSNKKSSIFFSPYRSMLQKLMRTLIELSEFIERIENALKIAGDVYVARVYEAAGRQLRVAQWTQQVTRKHRLLQQTFSLLKGDVDIERTLTLEIMIVVLIALEIVMALGSVALH